MQLVLIYICSSMFSLEKHLCKHSLNTTVFGFAAGLEPKDILLLMAAEENDTPKVEELLKAGANVKVKVRLLAIVRSMPCAQASSSFFVKGFVLHGSHSPEIVSDF